MPKKIKVIFDTNVLISFLIGKKLENLKRNIINERVVVIVTNQLIEEFKIVTSKEKLKKYFPETAVIEFITLLETISVNVEIASTYTNCRDKKDNFLLDLIWFSKADYLITGDKDLLELNPFEHTQIITPTAFEKKLEL